MRWDDVNARARGLATHLLDQRDLAGLAGSPDWPGFVSRLAALGYPLDLAGGGIGDPRAIDRAVGLVTSARLRLLGRWLAGRRAVLAVVLEDEERRSLRALLRGAAEGTSPAARLRAVVPTPALPARALERLARAASVGDLSRELVRLGHPAGRTLQETLRQARAPDLRVLEWALTRLFSERAVRAARPAGALVRGFAAELVDQANVWTLLLAGPDDPATPADREFLPGGSRLSRPEFARLRAAGEPDRVLEGLRALLAGTALGAALAEAPLDLAALEGRAAAMRVVRLRGIARRDPLGAAVVLSVLERIRAEARALRAIAWGAATGAPAATVARLVPEAA